MKQEQTIDDILKMLKDSVNDTKPSEAETLFSEDVIAPISEEHLKAQLQKQFGDLSEDSESNKDDAYALDDDFLQQVTQAIEETEALEEELEEETEEIETSEASSELEENSLLEDPEDDLAPWEALASTEDVSEEIEEIVPIEEEGTEPEEDLTLVESLAFDYVSEEEESLVYEILPRVEEGQNGLILRDYSTEPVFVEEKERSLVAREESSELADSEKIPEETEKLLSGNQYTTPALNPMPEAEDASAYDLMLQFDCTDEWEKEEIPEEEEIPVAEELSEYESYEQTEQVLLSYRTKKFRALLRLFGVVLGALILFFYETLPMLDVPFEGIFDYQEYIGAYLLMGFQILLICTIAFGKRMGEGALRLFSLHPNLYSLAVLSVICTGAYDLVVYITIREWVAPFHFLTSLFLLLLAIGEYLILSREMKIFAVFSEKSDRTKYTLRQCESEESSMKKMRRSGYSVEASVAVPEPCEFPHGFFRSVREDAFGSKMVGVFLIPALLFSVIAAVVTMLLHRELSITILTAMSMLMAILPMGAAIAVCFPLWLSAERLSRRQIALMNQGMIDELSETDALIFEDVHLFRQCTTSDTGIAFYDKKQMTTVLGCLERLYATIGGPLSEAFSAIPEEYRFREIRVRRLLRGGVEAIVEKKHTILVGDAAFMQRYGLNFPSAEETSGRITIYISLDGKISAKMSVRYQTEPIFEMLTERLHQKGVSCMIKTFDPMISAARVSSLRSFGNAPISVIHEGISELNSSAEPVKKRASCRETKMTVLTVASRFKLAEALIWSKALVRIRRINRRVLRVFGVLGAVLIGLLIGFGQIDRLNQYWFILWGIFINLILVLATFVMIPSKKYFSVDACRGEWQKKTQRENTQRKKKKGN